MSLHRRQVVQIVIYSHFDLQIRAEISGNYNWHHACRDVGQGRKVGQLKVGPKCVLIVNLQYKRTVGNQRTSPDHGSRQGRKVSLHRSKD